MEPTPPREGPVGRQQDGPQDHASRPPASRHAGHGHSTWVCVLPAKSGVPAKVAVKRWLRGRAGPSDSTATPPWSGTLPSEAPLRRKATVPVGSGAAPPAPAVATTALNW